MDIQAIYYYVGETGADFNSFVSVDYSRVHGCLFANACPCESMM